MRYFATILIATLFSVSAIAQEPLRVGIKESPPFAVLNNDQWTGSSVNVVKKIAEDLNRSIEYVPFTDVNGLIDAAASEQVDMSISAITITPEREHRVDFSQPYYTSSLGVLSREETSGLSAIMSVLGKLAGIAMIFIIALYVVGWIADKLDDGMIHSSHDGAWWALVTFTTTGYGDMVPTTARGKLFASGWMIASLFLLSLFTGYVASAMTVERIDDNPVTISDLHKSTVITLQGTTSEKYLAKLDVDHLTVSDFDQAIKLVREKKADAFVYDQAILSHSTKGDNFVVWPLGKHSEHYGIALPTGSPLMEDVNISILQQTQL